MPPPELSVVLPAYEEAENLDWLLPALVERLTGLGVPFEVLVVDAAEARDATEEVCARHGIRHVRRRGGSEYGHAIRTGIQDAGGRWVVVMDADGSHDPAFVARLWALRHEADVVIASRYVRGGSSDNGPVLRAMSAGVNVVFRYAIGIPCRDVSNSFRLYDGPSLRALRLVSDNFDIVEEILVKLLARRPAPVIREVPFHFAERRAGRTKRDLVRFAFGYLSTLRRLRALRDGGPTDAA